MNQTDLLAVVRSDDCCVKTASPLGGTQDADSLASGSASETTHNKQRRAALRVLV